MENDNSSIVEATQQVSATQGGITRSKFFMISFLLMGGIVAFGAKDYVTKYYRNITAAGRVATEYQPITNPNAPSFIAFKGQLESEGIQPEDSELSMFSFSQAAFQYRWLRGDESRVYVVRMNSHGMWDIYPQ